MLLNEPDSLATNTFLFKNYLRQDEFKLKAFFITISPYFLEKYHAREAISRSPELESLMKSSKTEAKLEYRQLVRTSQ
jgi:hypothetical protein